MFWCYTAPLDLPYTCPAGDRPRAAHRAHSPVRQWPTTAPLRPSLEWPDERDFGPCCVTFYGLLLVGRQTSHSAAVAARPTGWPALLLGRLGLLTGAAGWCYWLPGVLHQAVGRLSPTLGAAGGQCSARRRSRPAVTPAAAYNDRNAAPPRPVLITGCACAPRRRGRRNSAPLVRH